MKDKFEEVKLTGNGLVIDVSEEKEGSELLNWKGHAFKIKKDWEIMSESTGDKLEVLNIHYTAELTFDSGTSE